MPRPIKTGIYRKSGSPYYYCRWKDTTGRIIRRSTGQIEALAAHQTYQTLRAQHDQTTDPNDALTVNTLLELYHQLRGHELKGRGYQSGKKALLSYFDRVPWEELSQRGPAVRNIRNYIKHRQTTGVKPASINREIGILSAAANVAIKEGMRIHNHATGQRLSVPKTQYYWLTDDEAKALKTTAKPKAGCNTSPHLHDFLVIALGTGMRMSEILRLTRNDISRKHNVIRLPTSKSAEPHEIPMTASVGEAINCRLQHAERHNSRYLFCNPKTGKPLTSVINQLKNACKRAGIPVANKKLGTTGFNVHGTRHTVATKLIQKGVPLEAVQDLLNHSDIRTTQRYAHHAPDARKGTVDKLD